MTLGRHSDDSRDALLGITAGNQCVDDLRSFEADGNASRTPTQALELFGGQVRRERCNLFRRACNGQRFQHAVDCHGLAHRDESDHAMRKACAR